VGEFLLRRLVHGIFVVFGVVTIVFILLHMTGDPVKLLLPPDAPPDTVDELRQELGFDRPLLTQYADFIAHAAMGDFGESLRFRQPAVDLVLDRVAATVKLTAAALLFSLAIAVPIGVLSALRRGSFIDFVGMALALVGQSAPTFWLGLILILIFSLKLDWLPPSGGAGIQSLILPAITLGAYSAASITRILRSSLIQVISSDYVRTARAKGLSENVVLMRHALRNAALPVVTVIGLQVGNLLGGAVITEYVFSYPGIGRLVLQAISNRDFPIVQAFVVVVAITIVFINLLVDVSYFLIDPRIKVAKS
jgi:peptide/nickel transport system permease protein